jgi:hypothetical protein
MPWSAIRFDPENCDSLCKMPCHSGRDGWGKQTSIANKLKGTGDGEYTVFKKKQLGEIRFNFLLDRFHKGGRVDKFLTEMWLNQELATIKSKKPIIFGAH